MEEYGYVAPDPLDPNIIYGGKATRFNRVTGQTQDVSPVILRTGKYRFNRTAPLIFSPVDPHTLYLGSNVLFKTTDGGNNWQVISPDLTRGDPGVPLSFGVFAESDKDKGKHRGVIYSLAPSPKDVNLIWAGTDDGLIHVTHDGGKTWQNVTPPDLTTWSKLAMTCILTSTALTIEARVGRKSSAEFPMTSRSIRFVKIQNAKVFFSRGPSERYTCHLTTAITGSRSV